MLTRGQEIIEGIDEDEAVNIEVATGDAALFAYRIAHASYPNRSDDRRIAVAIRYIPPDSHQTLADWTAQPWSEARTLTGTSSWSRSQTTISIRSRSTSIAVRKTTSAPSSTRAPAAPSTVPERYRRRVPGRSGAIIERGPGALSPSSGATSRCRGP